ncbi:MAG TPA: hypothetical protein VGH49_01380 [Xanthobacteraceae bacterium]
MATDSNDLQRSAVAANKVERARDKEDAMREYEADRQALLANTVRLRALRLAKEAADAAAPKAPKPVKKKAVASAVAAKPAAKPRKSRKKAAAADSEGDDASSAE